LKYTWEFTQIPDGFIGVNTSRPNQIVEEGIRENRIPDLSGYANLKREVKYGANSRIDILLTGREDNPQARCWVEVKNVTLLSNGMLQFPDAVTERGQKHLRDLSEQVRIGDRAVMFYLINRPDGTSFGIAGDIDPEYRKAAEKAKESGVEILAYRARSSLTGVEIGEKVTINL
jgi:sugar fermentation stimulation protein A